MTATGESLHETQSVGSSSSHPSLSTNSSHSHARTQHRQSSQASSSKHPNLPPPPPPDRLPPPKGRSIKDGKLKLGKKKSRAPVSDPRASASIDDEEWTFEGGPTNGHIPTISTSRASSEMLHPSGDSAAMFDSQLTEMPAKEKKMSKGRGLAKKTSRLFMRDKDRDRSAERGESSDRAITPDSQSSLNLPSQSRQTSYSSVTSGESRDSVTTNGSSRRFGLNRPMSANPHGRTTRGHIRRQSQESHSSWQAPRPGRSGSTSTYDSPTDLSHLPLPHRQTSNLSASVPALSRQALPQPIPSNDNAHTLPSRMSMWFSHLMPSGSANTGSTAPSDMGSQTGYASSPPRKGPSVAASFLNAARQKAVDGVRNLLDTEAQPDKSPDTIWLMGVGHPGYRPTTPVGSPGPHDIDLMETIEDEPRTESARPGGSTKPSPSKNEHASLRPTGWRKKEEGQTTSPPNKGFTNLFTGSNISLSLPASMSPSKDSDRTPPTESPSKNRKGKVEKEVLKWPEQFYDDFRSTIWCTYRSQYAPILSMAPGTLLPTPEAYFSAFGPPADVASPLPIPHTQANPPNRPSSSAWGWSREERGLTTDAGWGCMLRTGQSLLANALVHLHLGRGWRLPVFAPSGEARTAKEVAALKNYATYVRVLSWFMDDPSPLSPFSVHRMALIGKELGKEVGEWFGPSTAAGALKTLTNSFPLCGVAVATATDSIVYRSEVYAASNLPSDGWTEGEVPTSPPRSLASRKSNSTWGDKAVLILIGIRLGLDGVNPIYYDSIKALFTFPQSVGIAGGRPSSSYYFVASQANSLFYLDPHFTRPAVPLATPPAPSSRDKAAPGALGPSGPIGAFDKSVEAAYTLDVVDVDDVASDSDSDDQSSPSSRVRRNVSSPAAKRLSAHRVDLPNASARSTATPPSHRRTPSDPFGGNANAASGPSSPRQSTKSSVSSSPKNQTSSLPTVDGDTQWYASAYSDAQLRTFHCEKVKKMPLSGLDPSMLLGFLIRNEADFDDFCQRVNKLPQKIFTVQEEPPSWDDSDDAGLESVSEPDPDVEPEDPDMDDLAEGVASSRFSPEFEETGNMSPITVSGRDGLRGRDMLPTSATSTVFPSDLGRPMETAEEDWEKGSGRDQGENTPSSQPVLLEAPSDLDLKHSKEHPTRPPMSSISRSEAESWVGVADEPDLSARTVTPPRDSPAASAIESQMRSPIASQKQTTPGSSKSRSRVQRTPESKDGSPTSGSGSLNKLGRAESSKPREEIKRAQIPSHWMTGDSPPVEEDGSVSKQHFEDVERGEVTSSQEAGSPVEHVDIQRITEDKDDSAGRAL